MTAISIEYIWLIEEVKHWVVVGTFSKKKSVLLPKSALQIRYSLLYFALWLSFWNNWIVEKYKLIDSQALYVNIFLKKP